MKPFGFLIKNIEEPLQNSGLQNFLQNFGFSLRTIKNKDMTEKEKEQIAIAPILLDVDCAVEGLKVDAKSIAETFGKVIGAEFYYWIGYTDYCTAAFDNEKIFNMDEMLVVLTRLSHWVDVYGSLLAVRCAINDWWDYATDISREDHVTINLNAWLMGKRPKGGKR